MSNDKTQHVLSTWAATLCLIFATACGGDNVIGPDNQLEVSNVTDSFQIQATALDNITEVLTYTWQTTGTIADVNQSGTVSDGTATLVIRDNGGTEVYRRSLAETGTFVTAQGEVGAWTIEVTLDETSGVLNFRVQKP